MKEEVYSGVVNNIVGNELYFKVRSAANVRAVVDRAVLARKNGAPMEFKEILVGDKVQVKGKMWPDNILRAAFVKNMSLYPHNSTFKGKVTLLSPESFSFVMQSKQNGSQTVRTDKYTEFKKNKAMATFVDLAYGMNVEVKGVWERSNEVVAAKQVEAKQRLLKITFKGEIKMTSGTAFTVVGENQVIYAVDVTSAKLLNKNKKPLALGDFYVGHKVQVVGKHMSEDQKIYASEIKNLAV